MKKLEAFERYFANPRPSKFKAFYYMYVMFGLWKAFKIIFRKKSFFPPPLKQWGEVKGFPRKLGQNLEPKDNVCYYHNDIHVVEIRKR